MQTENSIEPGQFSIQKLNEAREMVTVTKQIKHIFCRNKSDIKSRFTSSKVRLSGLRPEPSQPHWLHC